MLTRLQVGVASMARRPLFCWQLCWIKICTGTLEGLWAKVEAFGVNYKPDADAEPMKDDRVPACGGKAFGQPVIPRTVSGETLVDFPWARDALCDQQLISPAIPQAWLRSADLQCSSCPPFNDRNE